MDSIHPYPFARDSLASVRLYFQHWIIKQQLGYLISPSVPVRPRGASLRIADIACGTGIWLTELAEELPEARLDGYDVSTSQFPAREWLPKNVTLSQADALKPFPDHMCGQYDIVHIGYLVTVVKGNPGTLLSNLKKLLKPGGYLQWDEADLDSTHTEAPASAPSPNLDELHQQTMDRICKAGQDASWVRYLDKLFSQYGLESLTNTSYPITDNIARPWTFNHMLAGREQIEYSDNPAGSAGHLWELYSKSFEEIKNGATVRTGLVVAVGRLRGAECVYR